MFFIKIFVFFSFSFLFLISIEFPQQNINQSENGIGDKKLYGENIGLYRKSKLLTLIEKCICLTTLSVNSVFKFSEMYLSYRLNLQQINSSYFSKMALIGFQYRISHQRCYYKFRKIHWKTPAPESLFLYWKRSPGEVLFLRILRNF